MMSVKEAAERVRAFADHRSLENLRTDWDAPWREAMKVCATAALSAPTEVAAPAGYAVLIDDKSSPKGYWFAYAYITREQAEKTLKILPPGGRVEPIYFARSDAASKPQEGK